MRAKTENFDTVIIGGGAAGLTAATYLQRFKRRTLVIDTNRSRLRAIPLIRNLVGYSDGIAGRTLLRRLRMQAGKYGAKVIEGNAVAKVKRGIFEIQVGDSIYHSPSVVLATGVRDRQPPIDNYLDLCARGALAYCPICDGYDHSQEKIGVIVDSPSDFGKIKFLYDFSSNLHVIFTGNKPVPAKFEKKLARAVAKVHIGKIETLTVNPKNRNLIVKLQEQKAFELQTAYVQLGFDVPDEAIKNMVSLNRNSEGRFITDRHQQTSIRGLYAIGDCADSLAQVSVAVGEAAIAATHIHNQLWKKSDRLTR